jgi:hypothetical protein
LLRGTEMSVTGQGVLQPGRAAASAPSTNAARRDSFSTDPRA